MTLSRRIGSLEHGLKAKLFDRRPQGYTLTEAGQRLLPIAEEMERLALGAHESVGGSAASLSGSVRIGSPEGFGSYFLAPRISRLTEQHPQLNIQLVATSAPSACPSATPISSSPSAAHPPGACRRRS
jgi:DNA-binding transcriptional LysR family regulator